MRSSWRSFRFTRTLTLLVVALGFVAVPGRADNITGLKNLLGSFSSADEIHATLEVSVSRHSGEAHWSDNSQASVEVADGARGLHVEFPRALARRAQKEMRAPIDRGKDIITYPAVQSVSLTEVAALLDGAATLLDDLEAAKAPARVTPATYQGKPARLLVLELYPHPPVEARNHLESAECTISIWLDSDGYPLAAQKTDRTRVRYFLLSFENVRQQLWIFERRANRLFVAHHEISDSSSGLGQDFRTKVSITLRVH
jgi:hypothetical protein